MNIFGLYIGSANGIVRTMREACLDTARACEKIAAPMGNERAGDYGRGRSDAARDIRCIGDDIAADLNRMT